MSTVAKNETNDHALMGEGKKPDSPDHGQLPDLANGSLIFIPITFL